MKYIVFGAYRRKQLPSNFLFITKMIRVDNGLENHHLINKKNKKITTITIIGWRTEKKEEIRSCRVLHDLNIENLP